MNRKIALLVIAAALMLLMVAYIPVFAATSAGVSVTVSAEAKNIAISVSPGSYNYGALVLGTTAETTSSFTATNDGNVSENFFIRGANTTNWTLAASPGANTYEHDWGQGWLPGYGGPYKPLTTSNQPAGGLVAASGNISDYEFRIHMPTSSSNYGPQSTSVTFTATE